MNCKKSPKLTPEQCDELREMKRWLRQGRKGEVFWFPHRGVTVAVCPAVPSDKPEFLHVTWAIQSEHEPKFRKKLGAYTAISRLEVGGYLPMRSWIDEMDDLYEAMESAARNIADTV